MIKNNISSLLIIGSGGREHAIGLCIKKQNPNVDLFFLPGNAGTSELGKNITLESNNFKEIHQAVLDHDIDLTFVGPEQALVEGIVDYFEMHNLAIIGPSKKAAQLEGSKEWAKNFMKKYQIPTASFETFNDVEMAYAYVQNKSFPLVIKADGLAAGKGVVICQNIQEAKNALEDCFIKNIFKEAGDRVVIEEFLQGEEASLFAFTDGETCIPMLPCQDHKRIFDNDQGPNTGGMGAYCPTPIFKKSHFNFAKKNIFDPLIEGFKAEGIKYKGIIYAGLMVTKDKLSIVEFNVRFGDPETQCLLPLLKTSLLSIFESILEQRLSSISIQWSDQASVAVVLASKGYPKSSQKNISISCNKPFNDERTHLVHAGTKSLNGSLVTAGGRVLALVNQNKNLEQAIFNVYQDVKKISFSGMQYRKDIGQKAVKFLNHK